jgi:hypothetical protein
MTDKPRDMWKEAAVAYFKKLSQQLRLEAEINNKRSQKV